MTAAEFQTQIQPLLDPSQFVPVVLLLSTGDRVFIDMPEQLGFKNNHFCVTRRGSYATERYGFDVVERVLPADQLSADPGGISYAEFDSAIHRLLMQQPFRPFVIELQSGERIELKERRGTVRAGRFVIVNADAPSEMVRLSYDQIARLTPASDIVPV